MGKKVYQTLTDLSLSLPPAYRYEIRYEYGASILATNATAQFDGKPLDPKKKYAVKKGVPVNHYRTMKKILTQRGMKGVDAYVQSFFENAAPKGLVGVPETIEN